ncbi:hypothetical protein [Streptomyces sp. NPDC048442]|uniref:hypothetical protein n=1 Tax=Streptomyces sp. NPDC048442 TaxID=3154823 RepID=UPI00343A1A87
MHIPADYLALARTYDGTYAPSLLHKLTHCPYPFVWQALAANPLTPPTTLLDLTKAQDSAWNDNRLLHLLADHPRADLYVLRAVLTATATKLAAGQRPYAAALALTARPELAPDAFRHLGALPGASRRFRHGLTRRLNHSSVLWIRAQP